MAEYKVDTVGPVETFTTKDNVELTKYSLRFEGRSDWVSLVQKPDSTAPKEGDTLKGEIEQSDYGPKFKKERSGGGGRGFSPGAAYSSALDASIDFVNGWMLANPKDLEQLHASAKKEGKKPMNAQLELVESLVPKMKEIVDKNAGNEQSQQQNQTTQNSEPAKSESESGESKEKDVEIEDVEEGLTEEEVDGIFDQ